MSDDVMLNFGGHSKMNSKQCWNEHTRIISIQVAVV
jgi:hypothetical protein